MNRRMPLSDKPPRPTLDEVYAALDAAGAVDFEPKRDFPHPWSGTLNSNP